MEACISGNSRILVIIGAGFEQVPLYQLAREMGFFIVGTDGNPDAPGLDLADASVISSTRDAPETLRELEKFFVGAGPHGVLTIANDVPSTVAVVANHFDLPGMSIEAAHILSDKQLMKSVFEAKGIPTPRQYVVANAVELRMAHLQGLSREPAILKPRDGRGAIGVRQITEASDYEKLVDDVSKTTDTGTLLLEEFIPGKQFSAETVILGGKGYTVGLSERNYSRNFDLFPYVIEDGGDFRNDFTQAFRAKVTELMERVGSALNVDNGILKGDLVLDNRSNELKIIEVAGRLSGGWFASHQIPYATGVSIMEVAIRMSVGDVVHEELLLPTRNLALSTRYWFPTEGQIASLEGVDELKRAEGLVHFGFFRKVGDFQPAITRHGDRLGFVICAGDTAGEAIQRCENALEMVTIRVEN